MAAYKFKANIGDRVQCRFGIVGTLVSIRIAAEGVEFCVVTDEAAHFTDVEPIPCPDLLQALADSIEDARAARRKD